MKYRMYRANVENFFGGRPRNTQKLVIENELLFDDDYAEVRVYCVAYSNEPGCYVEFKTEYRDGRDEIFHVESANTPLFSAAALSGDTLRKTLYYLWLTGQDKGQ